MGEKRIGPKEKGRGEANKKGKKSEGRTEEPSPTRVVWKCLPRGDDGRRRAVDGGDTAPLASDAKETIPSNTSTLHIFKEDVWCHGWSTGLETRRPGSKSLGGRGNGGEREGGGARLLKPPLEISLTLQTLGGMRDLGSFFWVPKTAERNHLRLTPS